MKSLTQISRIFVGILFIISGFIKANDTMGFSYKLLEYFEIFHWDFFLPNAQLISMMICIFEIMVGIALLIGAYNQLNAWLLLLMIVFFTWLTGYSAITGKVTDCGCFGDAIKLTPVQSFLKDVVLLGFILFIFLGYKHIQPLFNPTIQGIVLFIGFLVTTAFTVYTYMFLPRIDFLPYKNGNDIQALMQIPEGAPRDSVEMVFIYNKDGKEVELNLDQINDIDDSYTFVDRKDKIIRKGYIPPIHDFKLYDPAGVEYTDSLLAVSGYKLILVQKSVEESRHIEKNIAQLAQQWQQAGLSFWALTASPPDVVEPYRHEHQLAFPYFMMDATPLKSMVRSNPGLMLLKGNTVIKKWGAYNFPTYETIQKSMK